MRFQKLKSKIRNASTVSTLVFLGIFFLILLFEFFVSNGYYPQPSTAWFHLGFVLLFITIFLCGFKPPKFFSFFANSNLFKDEIQIKRLGILLGQLFIIILFIYFLQKGFLRGLFGYTVFTIAFLITIFIQIKLPSFRTIFIFFLTFALVLMLIQITELPVKTDILPLITGSNKVLVEGGDPFEKISVDYSDDRNILFTNDIKYHQVLPTLWLGYLPAHIFNLDLRIINVLGFLVTSMLLWRIYQIQTYKNHNGNKLVFLLLIFFMLSPFTLRLIGFSHVPVYWLFFSLFLYFFTKNNIFGTAIFLAILISSRQLALVLLPFFLIYLFKRYPLKKVLIISLIFILTLILCILPPVLSSPVHYVNSVLSISDHYNMAYEDFIGNTGGLAVISFTPLFFLMEQTNMLLFLEIILFLLIFILALFKLQSKKNAILFFSFIYLALILFNFHVFNYYYYPLMMLMMIYPLIHCRTAEENENC